MIMSVRKAVNFTDARNAGAEVSVGLAMPSPPSWTGRARYIDSLMHIASY